MIAGLCVDLVAPDPGDAIRTRSRQIVKDTGDLHDPESVSRSYLIAAAIMKL